MVTVSYRSSWANGCAMNVCVSISSAVTIGFESETYPAEEGQGSVTVCARVMSGGLGRDVEVTLVTQDESAVGKIIQDSCALIRTLFNSL